jgi:hypothetical protein
MHANYQREPCTLTTSANHARYYQREPCTLTTSANHARYYQHKLGSTIQQDALIARAKGPK